MSKYTKIIAALGVAAGLGVASLPAAGVFAASISKTAGTTAGATENDPATVTGTAEGAVVINAKVDEFLTLEIDSDVVPTSGSTLINTDATEIGKSEVKILTNSDDGYNVKMTASYYGGDLAHSTQQIAGADKSSYSNTLDEYKFVYSDDTAADSLTGGHWTANVAAKSGVTNNGEVKTANISLGTVFASSEKTAIAAGDQYTVTYTAKALGNQAAGNYSGSVTYTAAVNE